MKFRLISGEHLGPGFRKYRAGDIVESDVDLVERFRNKFEVVGNDEGPGDQFSPMTVEELRAWAEENEVDISGAERRQDMLRIVRAENHDAASAGSAS